MNRYGERKPMQTKMKAKGSHRHIQEAQSAPNRLNSEESTPSTALWKHKSPSQPDLKSSAEKGQTRCKGRAPRQLRRSPAWRPADSRVGPSKSWKKRAVQLEWTPHRSVCVQEREAECFQAKKAASVRARITSPVNIKAVNFRGGLSNRGVLAAGFSLLGH